MQQISPFLWFNDNAAEAASFYTSIFPDSRIVTEADYGEGMPEETTVVEFELFGRPFTAFNGGPAFTFNEAISFTVSCETQEEVDRYWAALVEGGQEVQCGWLKDKFGLSWQITPTALPRLMQTGDAAARGRVFSAMMGMVKLDIAELQRTHAGG